MQGDTAEREGISRREFTDFRQEMRDYMAAQTSLMSQMVELQTKHINLESRVDRNERDLEEMEKRIRPLESNQNGSAAATKYNRDLIWLMLSFIVGLAAYALKR
ncbi:chromosome partitioning protein ParA [Photobacterium salinisoli]|uniref:chromosome partitioning protein ParA n=1 Tax=Photobacterium salinisoli TaxID=1616783 RepID=UPI000EA3F608|nr:chromosome partitioning protein ParA [Photobacterium salinisoli]